MQSSSPVRSFFHRWRWAMFALLLVGTLFPIGWLSTINAQVNMIDNLLFATDLSHAIAHALLFFAVGMSTLQVFPALRNKPWHFFALLALIGVGQEAFQLVYKQHPPGFDEYRDLATDAAGYVVAFVVARSHRRQP